MPKAYNIKNVERIEYRMADIFKKSFLEGYASAEVTYRSVAIALLVTLVIGLYIFMVYRVLTRKTFYSKNFNISLVTIALITAAIIVTIQSSVVVSLGMVGALSIVRFRTAIKDPMDLSFLFWAISVGIICGAGYAFFAVLLSLAVTFALVVLDKLPVAKAPMILIVNAADLEAEERILEAVSRFAKFYNVKSRNLTAASLDLSIELRTDRGAELVKAVMSQEGVETVSLLEHDGEVTF